MGAVLSIRAPGRFVALFGQSAYRLACAGGCAELRCIGVPALHGIWIAYVMCYYLVLLAVGSQMS
jgi:hypothetical protein